MYGMHDRRRGRPTLLERYSRQFGDLVERQHAEAALIAAKERAELSADQARLAQSESERANVALREEMDRRLQALADLQYLANHDPLTDLPNRNLFNLRLTQVLDRARRSGESVGLMFLDLDRFKDVNDTLGHDVGDEMLREIAARLKLAVRAEDTVARLGGDEFAIIQVGLDYPDDASVQARRILRHLSEPFHVGVHKQFVGASIGITVFPGDTASAEQLHKNADLAMYLAKEDPQNAFRFYDSTLDAVVRRRAFLEQALRSAIEQQELSVHYQPKIAIRTGDVVGAEALLRWQHPDQGLVPPAEFIPLAERTGLIEQIGDYTLRQACTQFQAWHRAGYDRLVLAVNLSATQFNITDIPKLVREVLAETGFPAAKLELEVTESAVMNDMHNAVDVLNDLHAIGVSLSIDDFGTGYSSLSYLRQLPVNRIKIDRSFIAEVDRTDTAATIARAVVGLGQSLGLDVVAEGVETAEQLEYLHAIGCDEAQGFLYGQPLPAPDFERYLAEHVTPRRG